ncbi:MAG: hypothetical protein AB7G93_21340 [Bdellovibrionales bacterium]
MLKSVITLLTLSFSGMAHATGGVHCLYESEDLKFGISAVTSRSFVDALVSAQGGVEAFSDGAPSNSFYQLARGDIRQYWNYGNKLNLLIYSEKDVEGSPLSSVKIVIETKSSDDINYTGKMRVEYSEGDKTWSASDRDIICTRE